MHENIIFCYSGSGNCLDIAKTIAHSMGGAEIVMMRKRPVVTDLTEAKTVGFVFPCHGGGLPGDVGEWLKLLKIHYRTYTYGVVSYAGYPGTGLAELNAIIPLNYWAGISHNCSCIWLLPHKVMLPPVSTEMAQARADKKAVEIAGAVARRETRPGKPRTLLLNRAEAAMWKKLAPKKGAGLRVDTNKCIACGQCAKLCPRENITLVDGRPIFSEVCSGCLSCLQFCPQEAISIGALSRKRERYHNPNVTAEELMQEIIPVE